MKNFIQENWCVGEDSTLRPPRYETGVLTTASQYSVQSIHLCTQLCPVRKAFLNTSCTV